MRKLSINNLIGAIFEYIKQGGKLPLLNKKEENVIKNEVKITEENNENIIKNRTTSTKNNELLMAIQSHDAFVEKVKKENKK